MGLLQISTCKNLGVDPDTGDFFCQIEHLNPSAMEEKPREILEESPMEPGTKSVPVCKAFWLLGFKVRKGAIKCDMAEEVETSIF